MVFIDKEKVKDMYFAALMHDFHRVTEKIRLFEMKYSSSFEDFENSLDTSEKEDFEKWDDYMEWKGCVQVMHKISRERKDLEVGDFKVS